MPLMPFAPITPILFQLCSTAYAAQVSLRADTESFGEGQSIGLALTVTDTSVRGGVPSFSLPEGLTAAFESQQQQQLMQNFNLTTSTMYRYTLTALRAGDFVIPAFEVVTAAGRLTTTPLNLHVEARGTSTTGVNELTGELSEAAQWVGQTVVYHLRFATDRQLANGNWVPPEGKGFALESGIEPVATNYTVGQGDKRVAVQDLYLPLRFTEGGTFKVPGGALQAQFAVERSRRRRGQMEQLFPDLGMFTDVRSEMFSAPSIPVSLKQPPKTGRPADYSGLIGHFSLSSHVTGSADHAPAEVKVGDTVTLALELTGDSPVTGLKLPPLVGDGFRVYDDQPFATGVIRDGKLITSSSFKRAVVPERPGPLTIPPVSITTFDPSTGAYVVLSSEAVSLTVVGAAATASVASFSAGPAVVAPVEPTDDLLPIRPSPALTPPWPGLWSLLLLLPGFALTAVLGPQVLLARRPARVKQQRLDFSDLPEDVHARLSGLEQIFREAVAPLLGMGAAAVHGEDLAKLGVHASEAEVVYRLIERARYAGGGSGAVEQVRTLEVALRAFVEKLK